MLRKARLNKRLTQAELGNLVGLSQGYISKLESRNGYYDKNLSVHTLIKLSKILNLRPVDVFITVTGCCLKCKYRHVLKANNICDK